MQPGQGAKRVVEDRQQSQAFLVLCHGFFLCRDLLLFVMTCLHHQAALPELYRAFTRQQDQIVDNRPYFHYQGTGGRWLGCGASVWNQGWDREGRAAEVTILAGIDEAGFGPLLGPLLVSCDAFSVEPALVEADLWETFKRSVGMTRKRLCGRLLIADSKKAFNRDEGLGHLERTSLAVLQVMGVQTHDVASLLAFLCPDCLPRLAAYPWHQDLQNRRLGTDHADAGIAAKVFADDLQSHGVRLVHLRSCCLDVAYYNTMIERVKNKSQVLFITTTRLIQNLLDGFPGQDIHVLIDRQGGRAHYREHLLRSFPGMDLRIVHEDDEVSTYELRTGSRMLRLTFEVKGDDHYLPVSLASMISKYVRELLMGCMNDYFAGLDGGLRPTAGYWKDGQRFIEDLRSRLPTFRIDDHHLIRCR